MAKKWEYQPLNLRGYQPRDDGKEPPTSAPPVESHLKLSDTSRETIRVTRRLIKILRAILEGK